LVLLPTRSGCSGWSAGREDLQAGDRGVTSAAQGQFPASLSRRRRIPRADAGSRGHRVSLVDVLLRASVSVARVPRGPAGAAGRPGEAARPARRAGASRRHAERAAEPDQADIT